MSQFREFWAKKDAVLLKPEGAVHTAQWDRCVAHVKQNNADADPYAVCTAMLGDESFKAMDDKKFNDIIDKALGTMGITAGGPIPYSLLSRQDLEGTTKKAFTGFTPHSDLVGRIKGNQKAPIAKGSSFKDLWSRVKPR